MPEKQTRQAKVKYAASVTINLYNYENIRLQYGIELECDYADVDATFKEAEKEVKTRLEAAATKIKKNRRQ